MLGLQALLKLTRSLLSSDGHTAIKAGSLFSFLYPGYTTLLGHYVSVPELLQTEELTHSGKRSVSCRLRSTGIVRAGARTAGVAQTTHVRAITHQPLSLLKPSQKLVAIAKIIPAAAYTSEWNTAFSPGLTGACKNSLERPPILHWWQHAGGQGGSGQAGEQQSWAHACHCHKARTARETRPYEQEDLWGSAEKQFWNEHSTAGQVGWFYCSWNAIPVVQIKSDDKVSFFWVTVNSLALHRQTAGSFYLSVCITFICCAFISGHLELQKKSAYFCRNSLLINSLF